MMSSRILEIPMTKTHHRHRTERPSANTREAALFNLTMMFSLTGTMEDELHHDSPAENTPKRVAHLALVEAFVMLDLIAANLEANVDSPVGMVSHTIVTLLQLLPFLDMVSLESSHLTSNPSPPVTPSSLVVLIISTVVDPFRVVNLQSFSFRTRSLLMQV